MKRLPIYIAAVSLTCIVIGLTKASTEGKSDGIVVSDSIVESPSQGFYSNEGGKWNGITTTELINLLIADGPVVVGGPGNSITFNSATCIIELLPAGGTPRALPSLGDVTCEDVPDSLLKNGRLNNVLIGQVVALTLNLRTTALLTSLGDLSLSAEFSIPVEQDCAEQFPIPESVLDILGPGATVEDLLLLAEVVLAEGADDVMEDINEAVTAVNGAFHQWRTMTEAAVEDDSPPPE